MKLNKLFLGTVLVGSTLMARGAAPLVSNDRLLSFEGTEIGDQLRTLNSTVTLSTDHFKDGEQSLKWDFEPAGELSINRDLKFEPRDASGADTYLSGFVVWVYSPTAVDDKLTFNFLKDGEVCTHFEMGLNFKGWRAAWVCYERDMDGTPVEGMNEIKIVAPGRHGQLYIDHLLTAAKMDHRYQTADIQVPFVNAQTKSHWLQLYRHSQRVSDLPLQSFVTQSQREEIATIESRFKDLIYLPSTLTPKRMEGIRHDFAAYGITRDTDGNIKGCPLFFTRSCECYERIIDNYDKNMFTTAHMEFKEFFNLMNRVAIAWNDATDATDKQELEEMFMAMYDHAADQGVGYGSCMGNFTHYGYSFRNYYPAYFLMKEPLSAAGKLEEASRGMLWYGMTNEVFIAPTAWGMDIDTFNTMTTGRIASILMMENSPEKVRYLQSFSRWLDNGCRPATGLTGCFKNDGSIFHHCNNYPAYAIGGLEGATSMIYLLSNTSFGVSELAHTTVKDALLAMRFYCNKEDFPISMSGRHPDGKGHLIPIHYARMALAGTPDRKEFPDREMAGAFLRLVATPSSDGDAEYIPTVSNDVTSSMIRVLSEAGCQPEAHPQGNLNLGYGCVNVHRQGNWSAVVRGHSRYLWAAEHYRGENLFGRYLAHGSLQLFSSRNRRDALSNRHSGWVEEGFDWSHIPGATALVLSTDQLKANVLNVDTYSGYEEMLFSDETFAGGVNLDGEVGAFGMKLHEHDKYDGGLRARKSYHFIGNRIVCLGSAIENHDTHSNTETTVMQLALLDDNDRAYWENPVEGKSWVMDHLETGYYFPGAKSKPTPNVDLARQSISNEGKPTAGDWVTMAINHGVNPAAQSYHYVIVPQTSSKSMAKIAQNPGYRVLKHDRDAHIVNDTETGVTSYVLFEAQKQLPSQGIIYATDTPCLAMVKKNSKQDYILSVANPDLGLYEGEADEIYDESGRRVERSIYSRPWTGNDCSERPVTLTLKGKWNVANADQFEVIPTTDGNTTIKINCREAASVQINLQRR